MAERQVWGFGIDVAPSGRISWPNEVKRLAVERVLEKGERIAAIAAELDTHENLVRKWCIAARRARGEVVSQQPKFTPVVVAQDTVNVGAAIICRLTVDNATLEFPSNIAEEDLTRLVRSLRNL